MRRLLLTAAAATAAALALSACGTTEPAADRTDKAADAGDPIGQMTEDLDLIAKATGTTERAGQLKKGFEAKLAEGRQKLAKAGREGTESAFADGYVQGSQVTIRPYTAGSLVGAVNEKLGLSPSSRTPCARCCTVAGSGAGR